jgi:hypothetical protein
MIESRKKNKIELKQSSKMNSGRKREEKPEKRELRI